METKNFKYEELACRHCGEEGINPEALRALQKVRDEMGEPLSLTSAYRCPDHPKEKRKARPGEHAKGRAFDISVPWGRKRARLLVVLIKHGFNAFGFADTFIHAGYKRENATSWTYR